LYSKAQTAWTTEEEETLRRMTAAHATSGQIARAVGNGRTRNAIIGKVARMGLKFSSGEIGGAGSHRARRIAAKAAVIPKAKPAPRPAPEKPPALPAVVAVAAVRPPRSVIFEDLAGVSLMALEAGMCRATVGRVTGADQLYCGGQTPRIPRGSRSGIAGFETYCDRCRRVLSKPTPSRAR
jgi:hypothetical protein